jgi:hypothetical protein
MSAPPNGDHPTNIAGLFDHSLALEITDGPDNAERLPLRIG